MNIGGIGKKLYELKFEQEALSAIIGVLKLVMPGRRGRRKTYYTRAKREGENGVRLYLTARNHKTQPYKDTATKNPMRLFLKKNLICTGSSCEKCNLER